MHRFGKKEGIVIKTQKHDLKIKILLLAVDIIMSVGAYFLGGLICSNGKILSGGANRYILVFTVFIVFFFAIYDLYKVKSDEVFPATVSATFSVVFSCVCTFLISFALKWDLASISTWLIEAAVLGAFLITWRTVAAILIKNHGPKRRCLILENMHNTSRLARKLKYASNAGRENTYFMIDEENAEELETILTSVIGDYDLIIVSPTISSDVYQKVLSRAFILGKDVGVLADLDNVSTFRGFVCQIDDTPVIEKTCAHMDTLERIIKRCFDIVFALILLILCIPIFLICAVMIKLDSKGPVFYKQERYTINKKIFKVYKFRTMVNDAEKAGAQFASENDPRITRVGKILRALRIDELPQIFNILGGSMSVVGPRPERPIFAEEFSKNVKDYDIRFSVKAGLTGYAQIYGKYNTRVSDKILMDIIYILNYSILLDIKIILLTGKTMFTKSATEGFDEEKDREMISEENEIRRREETVKDIEGAAK